MEDWCVGQGVKGDCLLASEPMQDAAMRKFSHPCCIVSHLLHPMLRRQEATLQVRQVERIGDANVMYSAMSLEMLNLNVPLPKIANPSFIPSTLPTSEIIRSKKDGGSWPWPCSTKHDC